MAPHLRVEPGRGREIALARRDADPVRRWEERRRANRAVRRAGRVTTTVTGRYVGLCVLVQFPDVAGTIPRAEVEDFCNRVGYTGFGNNGSVRDYFRDVSDGKLTYTNVVTEYHTAARPRDYYTDRTVRWPIRARELAVEVLRQLVAEGFDFDDLTVDGDGFVYALNLFYAGERVNAWSEGLWPGSSSLGTPFQVSGGPTFRDLQWTNMGNDLSIGTFCHENGHMLGNFPDLYDYGSESRGAGRFSLMATSGSKNPVQVDAYLKAEVGWASRLTVLNPSRMVSIDAGRNDFHLFTKNADEYFIVENRQQSGRDATLPGSGLAIWHVDENGSNSDEQMTPGQHYECSLEQADGRFDLERGANSGDGEDLFGAPRVTRFGGDTTPDSRWWDGSASGLTIRAISAPGPTMTFGSPWRRRGDDTPAWSDGSGWSKPQYYSTMRLAVARDDLYLLARAAAGVDLWRFDTAGAGWARVGNNRPEWSDAAGWSKEQYYSTMRLAVASDDLYLLARGAAGVDLWRFDTGNAKWEKAADNTPEWSDASGWSREQYYSTMRLAVARDDLYLLARGAAGVDLWRFDTGIAKWEKAADNTPAWSDASGWAKEQYYSTMRLVAARDDLYLLARAAAGVDLWRFDIGSGKWGRAGAKTPEWSDASGWAKEQYYSTMRLAVARDDLYLLARAAAGVDLWRFDTAGAGWARVGDNRPEWSDAAGWSKPQYYSTMRLAVARDDLYLLARAAAGVDLWRFGTGSGKWERVGAKTPEWSDASGWAKEQYYSTMRLAVARDDLYLLARGAAGVDLWQAVLG